MNMFGVPKYTVNSAFGMKEMIISSIIDVLAWPDRRSALGLKSEIILSGSRGSFIVPLTVGLMLCN
jgi:hypothetical protein